MKRRMARVKICGLRDADAVRAAIDAGADFLGFVFYPKSPRNISPGDAAKLKALVPAQVKTVAVTVDADDALLDSIIDHLSPDYIQLHGGETPDRARAIRGKYGVGIIKAIAVQSAEDITGAKAYEGCADMLLFDAKPATLPGGNGIAFDWALLADAKFSIPWILSGGLTPQNVHNAIAQTGASLVDVSSGVEATPGVKDAALIHAFIKTSKIM